MTIHLGSKLASAHRAEHLSLIVNPEHRDNQPVAWIVQLGERLRAEIAKRNPEKVNPAQMERRRQEIRDERASALKDIDLAERRIADNSALLIRRRWTLQQLDIEDQLLGAPR